MSLSSILEIGRSGISAFQSASEVTGENIANVNTPGYSRQRVIMETAPQVDANGFSLGTGVRIASIERYYDGLLQQQMVNAQTTQGYDTTQSSILQQIEPSFNEITNEGLSASISGYFASWQALNSNPTGTIERQSVLTNAQIMADNFHAVSKTLNDTIAIQNSSLVPMTTDINASLKDIAQLNGQIKITMQVSGNASELQDQRDQLIRELSSQIGITYVENSDGTTDIKYADGGAALVTGSQAGAFSLTVNGATGLYDVNLTDAAGAGPALVAPTTGALGATMAMRDTTIPGYLSQLDTLAKAMIDRVNALHIAGFSPTGGTNQNFFTPAAVATGAAASISLAAGLTITTIAASGNIALPSDNSNSLAISALQHTTIPVLGATFNQYFDGLASKVGLDVKSIKNTTAQDEAFTKQLTTLRESNSGVSLDEELTNLVKYQRSYQASAKLITTATDMMDTVIGLIR